MYREAQALLGAAALAASALIATAPVARADGAIAMGTTGNVVRDGIAFGQVVDEPKEAAAGTAIARCRTFHARAAAERCKVVVTFSRQCFAVAYDPEPGTPGAGWGVAPDQLDAMQRAVAMCEQAAGPARKGYCQVASTGCDTTGKEVSQTSTDEAAGTDGRNDAKTDAKTDIKTGVVQKDATTDTEPATGAPAAPTPQGKERGAGSGAPSPAFLAGVVATVGIGYTLGQLARGKAQAGFGQRQMLTGGLLAIGSGAVASLLGWAGLGPAILVAVVAGIAVAAAVLA